MALSSSTITSRPSAIKDKSSSHESYTTKNITTLTSNRKTVPTYSKSFATCAMTLHQPSTPSTISTENELGWMMNLFQPSVKLVKKTRLGSKLKRIYDQPTTPLDRLLASNCADPAKLEKLKRLRASLDPFKLSQIIEQKLDRIFKLANYRHSPAPHLPISQLMI